MSFTRFHDDECRMQKQMQEQTYTGRYMLNVPGNGVNMSFAEDPHLRLQKWGANWNNNAISIDNDLRGLNNKLSRDCFTTEKQWNIYSKETQNYPVNQTTVQQSRTTNPAWELRDKKQYKEQILFLDPQEHICIPFHNNLNTRMLEKDYYDKNNKY